MILYLRTDLLKSDGADRPANASTGSKGELRGGQYVARAQVGYDKDGSPKYRYFKSEEEYESFLQGKGRSKGSKELEDKVKEEHHASTEKQRKASKHEPSSRKHSLLASKEKEDKPVKKSICLFVRI